MHKLITLFIIDLLYILPEIFILMFLLYFLIISIMINNNIINNIIHFGYFGKLSISAISFTIILLCNNLNIEFTTLFLQTQVNYFTQIYKIICLFVSILFLIIANNYWFYEKLQHYEFCYFTLNTVVASLFMIGATDLINIYLSIEYLSLTSYILSAIKYKKSNSTEAGLKYFILGSFSSSLFLFGIMLIYGLTGSIQLNNIYNLLLTLTIDNNIYNLITFSLIFIISSLFFKLSAAPFHFWTPHIYEGAPIITTLFIATLGKLPIIFITLQILTNFFLLTKLTWQYLIIITVICSISIGTFGALLQTRTKRFMAFSTITNIGFLILPLYFCSYSTMQALFGFLIIYLLIVFSLFTLIIVIRDYNNYTYINNSANFSLLANEQPIILVCYLIPLFPVAGIPPLAGSYTKLYIIATIISNSLFVLAIIIFSITIITIFYYIRLIKLMLFKIENKRLNIILVGRFSIHFILSLVIINLIFFFFTGYYFNIISKLSQLWLIILFNIYDMTYNIDTNEFSNSYLSRNERFYLDFYNLFETLNYCED